MHRSVVKPRIITLTIGAGTGGVEARDFAARLALVYLRWAWRNGDSPSAKFSDDGATVWVEASDPARYAWEQGVHRMVRRSAYDPQGRRHTSFVTVEVSSAPEVPPASQVRSYVRDPYRIAKDHRTGIETSLSAWASGDLSAFYEEKP